MVIKMYCSNCHSEASKKSYRFNSQDSGYRQKFDAWMSDTLNKYGQYVSKDFPFHLMADASDGQLKALGWKLKADIDREMYARSKSSPKNEGDEYLHLIPVQTKDGFFLRDYYTNAIVAGAPLHGKHAGFFGPRKYMTILGGRGEYSSIASNMSDGDYFNAK